MKQFIWRVTVHSMEGCLAFQITFLTSKCLCKTVVQFNATLTACVSFLWTDAPRNN